jgi:excisionase family DNA binding protein
MQALRDNGTPTGLAVPATITLALDATQLRELAGVVADLVAAELKESVQRRPWMTTKHVAEYLSISVDAVHRLTGSKAIPHVKVSGRILVNRTELDEWLADHHEGPSSVSNVLTHRRKAA